MSFRGVIIEESLKNNNILQDVKILKTKIEKVTDEHKTPWLKQWTLHSVEISDERVDEVAKELSGVINDQPSSWYADFKNENFRYIIYPGKIFKIHRANNQEYLAATEYGISLGIPSYQVDFVPYIKQWER